MFRSFRRLLKTTTHTFSRSKADTSLKSTSYTYKNIGDLKIEADVYLPDTTTYSQLPVVFHVHGGGNVAGTRQKAINYIQRDEMLRRGWCVVSIDYRLAPFSGIIDMVEDVQDAYKWVRNDLAREIPINADAITLWGSSGGGCLSAIGGYMLNPRPQAIVTLYPSWLDLTHAASYDPSTPVSSELAEIANSLRQPAAQAEIVTNASDPRYALFLKTIAERKMGWLITTANQNEPVSNIMEILKRYSTLYHIDEDYPPSYLIHGAKDDISPCQHSIEMGKELEKKNVPHEVKIVPEIDHAFDFKLHKSPEWPHIWSDYIMPAFDFAEFHMSRGPKTYKGVTKDSESRLVNKI